MVAIPLLMEYGAKVAKRAQEAQGGSFVGNSAVLLARSAIAAVSALNIHSHNDYWRDVPLIDALSVGCKSVEADVYLSDGKLLVGHTRSALTSARSLDALYLDPMLEIFALQNPSSDDTAAYTNGVYSYDPAQSLQFIIDYKTEASALHEAIIPALERFRSRDLLSYLDTTTSRLHIRPLTVVCSGNCNVSTVLSQTGRRDIFLDAPLHDIANPMYTSEVAALASTSWKKTLGWVDSWSMGKAKRDKVRALVEIAHAKGIQARFWETPSWPAFVRDNIWRGLLASGVDYINADDLYAASQI
ncbi:hypothetical protein Rhopal_002530-T1 [Rhodotorula paludigena]|uniref:Altered inheritance of mitochondria protein 6 n=1 Tax=Rhodotorula paludigena TaxID=86838 RepID=A0AAV5GLJ6_9BASI|nr:hypothetical protein Rhopal_002530-T1 [Rhodotorula paludigena]